MKRERKVLGNMTETETSDAWREWLDRLAALKPLVGSPIELAFAHRLATRWQEEINGPLLIIPGSEFMAAGESHCEGLAIFPQVQIGKYRVDFLLRATLPNQPAGYLVVECDGHDYHERTKEQARHDRSRDREIMLMGIRVIRFTGSEIHADATKCAGEALSHLLTSTC